MASVQKHGGSLAHGRHSPLLNFILGWTRLNDVPDGCGEGTPRGKYRQ